MMISEIDAPPLQRQRTGIEIIEIPDHVIAVSNISKGFLYKLLEQAKVMEYLVKSKGGDDRLKGKVLAALFYEPSTRTSCSFQAAMQRLGGSVICVNEKDSSAQKGETIEDTIQTLSCYCDAIVIRNPMKGSALLAASVATKPVINAGDGTGEHPTQALLDVFTIQSELGIVGSINPSKPMIISVVGDLKNGRTVHSLVKLLCLFSGVKIQYVSPESLSIPDEVKNELRDKGLEQNVVSLDEAIVNSDVLYVTRIQKERFTTLEEYEQVAGCYVIDAKLMEKAKAKMIVMHPLPRNSEIAKDVDKDPRAAYFRQMENGMYMRMALLDLIFSRPV